MSSDVFHTKIRQTAQPSRTRTVTAGADHDQTTSLPDSNISINPPATRPFPLNHARYQVDQAFDGLEHGAASSLRCCGRRAVRSKPGVLNPGAAVEVYTARPFCAAVSNLACFRGVWCWVGRRPEGSTVKAVRTTVVEWARWGVCAELEGLSRNAWLRRAANEAAALEESLRRESAVREELREGRVLSE